MQGKPNPRRPYGSGSLHEHRGAWYGTWWVGPRQVKRKVGAKRRRGTSDGLTRRQAESQLRRMIEATRATRVDERLTLEQAAERYIRHLELVKGNAASTIEDYGIMLRRHFAPFFSGKGLDRISADDVVAYMHAKRRTLAAKTVRNHLIFLHGVFSYAVKRGWATTNPVAAVDRPRQRKADQDIRYLTPAELELVIRAVPDDLLGPTDRVLYLAAAVTGYRQGELIAMRWRYVDWLAGRIRVRQNRTRGRWGDPKSYRGNRAVPMTERLARELERHFQRSEYQADDHLVFCHPQTGNPCDPSKIRKRFKEALDRAGVRRITFHELRHTFGTHVAAAGVPPRTLQEWMGHRDPQTTAIYAHYAPSDREAEWIEAAFGVGNKSGNNLSETQDNSGRREPHWNAG
jgi:integrase